jgi:hypothetical protein
MRLLSTVACGPWAAKINGLITRRRRLHHIRNSIVEDRSFTAIRAAQDRVIDDDLVLGFLQFEAWKKASNNCRDPAVVSERQLHPSKPTNPPAQAIVSSVP